MGGASSMLTGQSLLMEVPLVVGCSSTHAELMGILMALEIARDLGKKVVVESVSEIAVRLASLGCTPSHLFASIVNHIKKLLLLTDWQVHVKEIRWLTGWLTLGMITIMVCVFLIVFLEIPGRDGLQICKV